MTELAHRAAAALPELTTTPGARVAGVNEFAVDEVAAALRIARPTALRRLATAMELTERMSATLAALRDGTIHEGQARVICHHTATLLADDADGQRVLRAVEAAVLATAAELTPGELRARVDRVLHRADPAAVNRRHRRAVAERRVELWPQPDGMATLAATLPADVAYTAYRIIDGHARTLGPDDPRGMDARRADCLTDLILDGAGLIGTPGTAADDDATAASRVWRPVTTVVHVTVPITTLLGVDDEPGELAGYGPVPSEMARRIAAGANSRWRRLLTDPTNGTLLDVATTGYRPPPALDRHVRTRDGTCRFPGCRRSAWSGDLDHTVPYPHGPTAADNLTALCRHHHQLKTSGRWRVDREPGAALTWTSPTGHRYRTTPAVLHPAQRRLIS